MKYAYHGNNSCKLKQTVSLSATDNLAGVAKTEYSLDDGSTWQPYTSANTFDKEDKYISSANARRTTRR